MQPSVRSNSDRSEATRGKLVAVARTLFVRQGYAATSTPQVAEEARVTRGAIYHHFADKQALFLAVAEAEAQSVAGEVRRAGVSRDPVQALISGGDAYLGAMVDPGRARLLLVELPAVVGVEVSAELHACYGEQSLREGLRAAMDSGLMAKLPIEPLTRCLGAAYDRSALAVVAGAALEREKEVLHGLVLGLTALSR